MFLGTAQLKEVAEKLPSEILESENFISMHAQVESFLEMTGPQDPEESSLPPQIVHDQHNQPDQTSLANQSSEGQDKSLEDNVHSPQVQEMQQNIEVTPRQRRSSISDIREGALQPSAESGSGSPKPAREVIEQFEPGVYVTLIQLSNGTKVFKRVKFRYFAR